MKKFTDVLVRVLIKITCPRASCWKIQRYTEKKSCNRKPNFTL